MAKFTGQRLLSNGLTANNNKPINVKQIPVLGAILPGDVVFISIKWETKSWSNPTFISNTYWRVDNEATAKITPPTILANFNWDSV
ncbi:hypothetical protein N9W11_07050, partial [Psychrosphaera haliotis]|nr:hypothetical protein [Psychrosphaera haliotis]